MSDALDLPAQLEAAERRRRQAELLVDLGAAMAATRQVEGILRQAAEGALALYRARAARAWVGDREARAGVPGPPEGAALLVAPLGVDGETPGQLAVELDPGKEIDAEDEGSLARLAQSAGLAIENARLLATSEGRRQALETLVDVARLLAQSMDPVEVSRRIVEGVRSLFGAQTAVLYQRDLQSGDLVVLAAAGPRPPGGAEFAVPRGVSVSGRAVETRRAVATTDFLDDPRIPITSAFRDLVAGAPFRAALAVPLMLGERVMGALVVTDRPGRRFDERDAELLQSFADQASLAIDNARQFAATQLAERASRERAEELDALGEVARLLGSTLDVDAVTTRIADSAVRLLGGEACTVHRLDALRGALTATGVAARRTTTTVPDGLDLSVDEPLVRAVVAEGRVAWSPDVAAEPGLSPGGRLRRLADRFGVRSVALAPLRARHQVVGTLVLGRAATGEFGDREIRLLQAFADHAAIAFDNARLFAETETRLRDTEMLLELSRGLASLLDVEPLLRQFMRALVQVVGADTVGTWVMEPETGWLAPLAGYRVPPTMLEQLRTSRLKPEEGSLFAEGIRTRRAQVASQVSTDPRIPASIKSFAPHRTLLFVPIVARDRVIAAFLAAWWHEERRLSPREIGLLEAMAGQAGIVLDNARLFQDHQRRLQELEILYDLSREVAGEVDLARLGRVIHDHLGRLLDVRDLGLFLYDEARREFETIVRMVDGVPDVAQPATSPLGLGLMSQVVSERRAVRTADYSAACQAAGLVPAPDSQRFPHWLGVPMIAADRVVGAIGIRSPDRPFRESDERLLANVAGLAALTLRSARLYRESEERRRRLATLVEVAQRMTRGLDLPTVLRGIADAAALLFEGEAGFRLLEGGDLVRAGATAGALPAMVRERLPATASLGGEVVATGRPLATADVSREARAIPGHSGVRWPDRLGAVLCVPLRAGARILGVLYIFRPRGDRFDADAQRLAQSLADQAGIAIDNARLYDETRRQHHDTNRLYGELRAALATAESSQQRIVQTERLRALGQMAGGVAHDFNNALAVILGRTQLLLRQVQDPSTRRQLQVVETVSLDAARTVRRIQEFARMRRSRPFHQVDLGRVVREVVEVTRTRWRDEPQAAGIAYQIDLDLDPAAVVAGDAAELQEALTNIVFNALDAMPAGGRLTLRAVCTDGQVVCSITDTGSGMSDEIRRRVFDPFFTTKGERGSGLGLSMAYGIVSRHGGEIDVESAPGRGTTVTIRLPAAAPSSAVGRGVLTPAEPRPVSGRSVLLIDDEPEVRDVLRQMLEALGHRVVAVEDGTDGLTRLAGGGIDLVVTDLGMPGLSGWDVARLVRADHPGVSVVLVTGWGDQIDPAEARRRGVDAVLSKPFTAADLEAAIVAAVGSPVPSS